METSATRGLALARKLKARNWEPIWLAFSSQVFYLHGDRSRARKALEMAVQNESALSFVGGWVFGLLSMVSDDPVTRARALQAGERLMEEGCMGESILYFYRFAIEACLDAEEWHDVERYAQALEDYTRTEPLPWSDFFIARGRALAVFGRGQRDASTMREIQRLHDEAERVGLKTALPALSQALATVQKSGSSENDP